MAQDGEGLDESSFLPLQGMKASKEWTLWFLQEGTRLERARDSSRETCWSCDLLSVQKAEGRNSVLFQPPLCPTAITAQSVLRGRPLAKFSIFSRSQERRGRWVGRGKKLTCKKLGKEGSWCKKLGVLDIVEGGTDSPRSQRSGGVTQGSGMTLQKDELQ